MRRRAKRGQEEEEAEVWENMRFHLREKKRERKQGAREPLELACLIRTQRELFD